MPSIFHFFDHLRQLRAQLISPAALKDLPFDPRLIHPELNADIGETGRFPDRILRCDPPPGREGGELIEFKDSRSFSVPSFNSTLPAGSKRLDEVLAPGSARRQQLIDAGEDLSLTQVRQVYYLLRGRRAARANMRQATKVCLVHGGFFETLPADQLVRGAFAQVLEEVLGQPPDDDLLAQLAQLFANPRSFARSRTVPQAAVSIRFRIMTEAKRDGNPLDGSRYPQIDDDTLTLICPQADQTRARALLMPLHDQPQGYRMFTLNHRLNGPFFAVQTALGGG